MRMCVLQIFYECFQKMTKRIVEFRQARGWKKYHGPKDMALGMLVEAAEFAELVQYFTGSDLKKSYRAKRSTGR